MSVPDSIRRPLTAEERRLIDEAIAEGRVRRLPMGAESDQDHSSAAAVNRMFECHKRRQALRAAQMRSLTTAAKRERPA